MSVGLGDACASKRTTTRGIGTREKLSSPSRLEIKPSGEGANCLGRRPANRNGRANSRLCRSINPLGGALEQADRWEAMAHDKQEGSDPAAQQAADDWRRRFGREGHEGSYAQHEEDAEVRPEAEPPAKPNRTS